jgi:arylsulfatase A-like enzyme
LTWAEQRLQTRPDPVPIPASPPSAAPRWPVVRLTEPGTFGNARKTSAWEPAPAGNGALAQLGPFRSDQPTPTFQVRPARKATAEGKDSLELGIGGFDVRCEDVGSVELTIRVPFGRHLTLKWSKAGSVRVPVESLDEPFTVRVLTDGFAEWQGSLRSLSIITDGRAPGSVIEIQSLRFLPRAMSYPAATGVKRVRLGHEIRTAIYAHCPAEVVFDNLALPVNAKLHVGIGHVTGSESSVKPAEPPPSRSETGFDVSVAQADTRETVFSRRIAAGQTWTDVSASLAKWGGQQVTLTLKCTSATPETVAFWANPVIYTPLDDPPLLVVYLIDTVAAEHLDFYGYGARRQTMPRLQAMAAQGVFFSRAYSNSSRTIESIPDLMLSMPVERHGVHHNSTPAAPGLVTIAEALRAAGFATVSFCTNVNAGPRQGMDQGFETFVDKIGYYWTHFDRTIPLDEVMAWIPEHRDRAMFLYIHTAEPHAPYTPPEGFAGHFDPDYPGPIDGTYARATTFRRIRNPRTQQRDWQHVVALYDEEVLYSDARFGQFLDALAAEGLRDQAHIFVTSDHGEEFLQHGHWEHGLNLHNEQTRIPLIACGPTFVRGARVDFPVQLFDVMPTILDMFDLPAPYPLAGKSLLPLLRGATDTPAAEQLLDVLRTRDVYASNHNYRISQRLVEYSVLEQDRWKLVYGARPAPMYPNGPRSRFLLFDRQDDPFERRNVIHQHQDVARRLIDKLIAWRAGQRPYETGAPSPTEIDAAHMRELQALGYLAGQDEPNEPNEPGGTGTP